MIDDSKKELLQALEESLRELRGLPTAPVRRRLEKMLKDLANASDDQAIHKLQISWPELSRDATGLLSIDFLGEREFFDTPADLRRFYFLRHLLRRLWVADEEAVRKLEEILVAAGDPSLTVTPSHFRLDWRRGTFTYQPQSELQRALYYLAQNSIQAKLCGNPDCEHPYFIAALANELYCCKACSDVARRQARRNWWGEHGAEWRRAKEKARRK